MYHVPVVILQSFQSLADGHKGQLTQSPFSSLRIGNDVGKGELYKVPGSSGSNISAMCIMSPSSSSVVIIGSVLNPAGVPQLVQSARDGERRSRAEIALEHLAVVPTQ